MIRTLPLLMLVIAACSERSAPPKTETTTTPTTGPAPLADASAKTLAKDIDDADRLGTWKETKTKWQGQSVKWQVIRRPALCRSADACNVAAFAVTQGASSGWMPQLTFAAGQWDALVAACGDKELCDIAIEGKLDTLVLSADSPTSVKLRDVKIASVRTAAL